MLLMNAGVASSVSPVVEANSCGKDFVHCRVSATGTFAADSVTVQHSPDSGTTWFTLGTLGKSGDEFVVEDPFDWIRAIAGPAMTGVANVFLDFSA
jgi:hypothetical protein